MNLTGRSAIITGANRGLGRAIAERFVAAGASVYLTGRDSAALEETIALLRSRMASSAQRIDGSPGDVSNPATCRAWVSAAAETIGPTDILVNNAGVYGPLGATEDVDWDEWVQAIQVNLFGTLLMCRAVIPSMRARRYGKIINLSGGGATAPLPRISAYAASKAAVVRLSETLAEELKDARIDVNAIAPGPLNTRLLDQVLKAGPEKVGEQFYERSLKQRDEGGAPLAKGAELALFLASADSDGITGRLLSAVWDDWQGLPQHRAELAKSDVFTLRRIVPGDRGLPWGEVKR